MRAVVPEVRFVIEDEHHADQHGEFQIRGDAIAELTRRSALPWDADPNRAPCTTWRTCGRHYAIVEYDVGTMPWQEIRRESMLDVSAIEVKWAADTRSSAGRTEP